MSVNKFIGIGRLARDPESKEISNDFKVANFSIAISEKWKDKQSGETKESTEWINCQASNKVAEIAEKYVKKGDQVYIEGKFKTRSWEKDGVRQYATYIQVETIQMLGGKKEEEKLPTYESPLKPNPSGLPQSEMAFTDGAKEPEPEDDGQDLPF